MYKVRREWTVREVPLQPEALSSRYALLRWLSLSLGLIGDGDRREGVIHLLDALFTYWFVRGENPSFEDIYHHVRKRYLERGLKPPTEEAVRRHLRKLMAIGLVYRESRKYFLATSPSRPDDPSTAVDSVFSRIMAVKDLIKSGFLHLKNLYT